MKSPGYQAWMSAKPLNPPPDPLLKSIYAPRQSRMLTELISQLQVLRFRHDNPPARRITRQ